MTYKITRKVLDLVENLIRAGYRGEVKITDSYPTGTWTVLEGAVVIELSGFCKESLYIVEDLLIGTVCFVGRYSLEDSYEDPTVEDIIRTAWNMYTSYESRGYGLPYEFEDLFIQHGYLKKVTETKTRYVKAK